MQLMLLKGGGLSLEFAESDMDAVREAMLSLGEVQREEHATHVEYCVAGGQLLFMNDWDDPCLIAGDRDGVRVVRAIFDRLIDRAGLLSRAA